MVVLDQIPVTLTIDEVMGRLRNQADLTECAAELLARVRTVVRPKAAYAACFIEEKSHDGVTIDGVRFTSRVLRTNLDPVGQAFPFVATCGAEVDALTREQHEHVDRETRALGLQASAQGIVFRLHVGISSQVAVSGLDEFAGRNFRDDHT